MATRYEKLVADAKKNITEISPTDTELKSKSSDVVIVDVREKDEWDEERIPEPPKAYKKWATRMCIP
jgi:rhodanese-related sulfurtransferase